MSRQIDIYDLSWQINNVMVNFEFFFIQTFNPIFFNHSRCKKSVPCKERDAACLQEPLTISKNYISFTSKIRIPSLGYVDMFTMRGPSWSGAQMHFHLDVKNIRSNGVPSAGRNHFLLRRPTQFQAVVALAKPIEGPQVGEIVIVTPSSTKM